MQPKVCLWHENSAQENAKGDTKLMPHCDVCSTVYNGVIAVLDHLLFAQEFQLACGLVKSYTVTMFGVVVTHDSSCI